MATLLVASFHTRPQLLHFDPTNATLTLETLATPDFRDYTWISAHPKHKGLFYALQRYSDAPGILSIVKLTSDNTSTSDPNPPHFEILKSYPSYGMDPCHLGISTNADELSIANVNTSLSSSSSSSGNLSELAKERIKTQYDTSTVTMYTLNPDGMVNEDNQPRIYDLSKEEFKIGPHQERQEAAHPHGCFWVPALECFLVPDLGADKLRLIGKDRTLPCEAGSGPRQAVVNPDTNIAYIVNELNNTITIHDLSTTSPSIASYSVLPSDAKSQGIGMCASAINITPDKRLIYVTNRLESHPEGDAVVWFKVTSNGRALERTGEVRTGLDHPRAAEIFDYNGITYYIVGSKTEKGAVVYSIDNGNEGNLKEVARDQDVLSPSGFVAL